MVSDWPKEVPSESQDHLGTDRRKESDMFKGGSSMVSNGTVATMSDRPSIPDPDPRDPGPRRIIRDRGSGSKSSPPVEPAVIEENDRPEPLGTEEPRLLGKEPDAPTK
jgi:hypothetical protein